MRSCDGNTASGTTKTGSRASRQADVCGALDVRVGRTIGSPTGLFSPGFPPRELRFPRISPGFGDTQRHDPTRRKEETEREVPGQRTEMQR